MKAHSTKAQHSTSSKQQLSKVIQQSEDNIYAFMIDDYFAERRNVFMEIVKAFEKYHIQWAISCSFSLFLRGLIDDFNDFDLIVNQDHIQNLPLALDEVSAKLISEGSNGYCNSDMYMHCKIGNCDIDIICGFRINTFGTSYYSTYTASELDHLNSEYLPNINLIPLETLFIQYAMMEGWQRRRRYKKELIYNFLMLQKPKHKHILERALTASPELPPWIIQRINELFS